MKAPNNNSSRMSLLDHTKKALYIALHPGSINDSYGVGDAMVFYYKAAIIPAIIVGIIGFVLAFAFGTLALGFLGSLFGAGRMLLALGGLAFGVIGLLFGLAYLLVLIPISIIINAAIYQLFAKRLFHIWKNDISKTVTAVMFGTLPLVLLFWTFFIPIVGEIIFIAVDVWCFIVLIISMARQQQVSGWRAFGGMLISGIVIGVIVAIIEFAVLAVVGTSTSHIGSSCIAQSGFVCSKPVFSNGVFTATIGQSTGSEMFKSRVFFVPLGQNLSTSDPSYYVGNLTSGSIASISINGIKETNNTVFGNLEIEYYDSVSQKTPYTGTVATFYYSG